MWHNIICREFSLPQLMKTFLTISSFLTLMILSGMAIKPGAFSNDGADQVSRTVVHKDGTYTTTQKDQDTRTLVRQTKRKNNTLIIRSEFALDEFGRERKGREQTQMMRLTYGDGDGHSIFRDRIPPGRRCIRQGPSQATPGANSTSGRPQGILLNTSISTAWWT